LQCGAREKRTLTQKSHWGRLVNSVGIAYDNALSGDTRDIHPMRLIGPLAAGFIEAPPVPVPVPAAPPVPAPEPAAPPPAPPAPPPPCDHVVVAVANTNAERSTTVRIRCVIFSPEGCSLRSSGCGVGRRPSNHHRGHVAELPKKESPTPAANGPPQAKPAAAPTYFAGQCVASATSHGNANSSGLYLRTLSSTLVCLRSSTI
jgi:hypothetical protein